MSNNCRSIFAASLLLTTLGLATTAEAGPKKALAIASAPAVAVGAASAAEPTVPQTEAPAAAAEPVPEKPPEDSANLVGRFKSMFGGPSVPTEKDQMEQGKAEKGADAPSFLSRMLGGAGGSGAGPSKVKDITEVFSTSAKQFDPTCKALIEPFGMTDNMMSLGMLAAKIAANNTMVRYGVGGKAMDLRGTLRLAGKNLNWLPMEAERMLGEKLFADMSSEILDAERKGNRPAVQQAGVLLKTLLAQVKEETPYKFQIAVRRGAGNAQALPGGFILIDRDLVASPKNEDKAYFALAHELAHVLQRHETRATQARLTDSIESIDGLRKLIDGTGKTPASVMVYSNEIMTRFVIFSKDQEMQADSCAVRLLEAAFPDKKRLNKIINSYQASLPAPVAETAASGQLDLLIENVKKMDNLADQHPNSQERIANLSKMLNEVNSPKPAPKSAMAQPQASPVAYVP